MEVKAEIKKDGLAKTPECPYCGKLTVAFFIQNNDSRWELYWGCNCKGVKAQEKKPHLKDTLLNEISNLSGM